MAYAPLEQPTPLGAPLPPAGPLEPPSPLGPPLGPPLGSPFAGLLGSLGISQTSPLPSVPIDVQNGFRAPGPGIGWFGPGGGGISFPQPPVDHGPALANIHQILAHHHDALQSLLAAIHSMANTSSGNPLARRGRPSHPLPLQ